MPDASGRRRFCRSTLDTFRGQQSTISSLRAFSTKRQAKYSGLDRLLCGSIAKLDISEAEDGVVTPVDYKRGKRPHVALGVYEPERIQICLQGLLLEEHGYRVEEGAIY